MPKQTAAAAAAAAAAATAATVVVAAAVAAAAMCEQGDLDPGRSREVNQIITENKHRQQQQHN